MSGFIPRAFIDQLLAITDLVAVIDERVPLKKAGKNFNACCPFHKEKSPSFTVIPEQQFYHCFGCGMSGNVISFLMEYDRLDFVSVIESMARSKGLSVPYEENANKTKTPVTSVAKSDAYDLLMQVAKLYQKQLRNHKPAADYLQARGLDGETAKRFGVGFAPDHWRFLEPQLPQHLDDLTHCGMLIRKDDGQAYDRFRGRIMFPIRDMRGRVMAFGGRVLTDEQPKYLNSPETPYFHKGQELYGLYEARQANRQLAQLIVVEGYLDVLALAQHGITQAVATLGTATTTEHIEKMSRLTSKIVFCFDGDRAGRQAAWRALNSALPALRDGVSLHFLFLADGEDPDSYIRQQGKAAFEHSLNEAQALSHFLFHQLSEACALHTAEGRAKLVDNCVPLLQQIPVSTLRNLLIEELGQRSKMTPKALLALLRHKTVANDALKPQAISTLKAYRLVQSPMRAAIHLLLLHPMLSQHITAEWLEPLQQLTLPGSDLWQSLLERTLAQPDWVFANLLESYRDHADFPTLLKLSSQPALDLSEPALQQEWSAVLKKLLALQQDQRIQTLMTMKAQGLTEAEKNELVKLLQKPQWG